MKQAASGVRLHVIAAAAQPAFRLLAGEFAADAGGGRMRVALGFLGKPFSSASDPG